MYNLVIRNVVNPYRVDSETGEITAKDSIEVLSEESALKTQKTAEVQAKVDAYKAAQLNQIQNGGPAPVAEFEIMKIVNEYNSQFEITLG